MNSCVLMAEVVSTPELRYLQDGQMIAEMTVQFPALRAEDPMETLKVVGWGNLAQIIQEQIHLGDQLVLEGRLSMVVTDRPEGFKEKRAELTANRLHRVQADLNAPRMVSTPAATAPATPQPTAQPVAAATAAPAAPAAAEAAATPKTSSRSASRPATPPPAPANYEEPNYDDIPF
jgi:single-strand DNA-binding protein